MPYSAVAHGGSLLEKFPNQLGRTRSMLQPLRLEPPAHCFQGNRFSAYVSQSASQCIEVL